MDIQELIKKADVEFGKWFNDPKTENEDLDGYDKWDSISVAILKYKEILKEISK